MRSLLVVLAILSYPGVAPANSLLQRFEEGVRRERDNDREDRDALSKEETARERARGFQMLINVMVRRLADSGFYVDKPRLLGAAIVSTNHLEVTIRTWPANGRGQIAQEVDVIYVRNGQVCRMHGVVTTLNSVARTLSQRFIEYSSFPSVNIPPEKCVALEAPKS